jgi:Uma2 family endonuclease
MHKSNTLLRYRVHVRRHHKGRASPSERIAIIAVETMKTILDEAAAGRATIVPWTIEQYHRAIAAGLLRDDAAVELLDGFIVRKDRARAGDDPMTIGDRHRIVVLRLAQAAPRFEPLECFLQTQQPVSLPPTSEPEPDAAVVRGQIDDYLEHPPTAADLYAIVEVADSSLALDLGPKLRAYAAAGVRQYVVVDLVADRVLVHEEPTGESYARVRSLTCGDQVPIAAGGGCCVTITADRFLP